MMSKRVKFEYDDVDHANDVRSCHYTPLKGVVAYQETLDDWAALSRIYGRAKQKVETIRGLLE